jgi:hypothetical protein
LTFWKRLRKSNGDVPNTSASFYLEWRLRGGVVSILREDSESPPERLVQSIWQHQRLVREKLRTLDGRPVRVLHPGFRSVEAGPDFRNALIQVGEDSPRSGDIEVDLKASGWTAHGHHRNPAFKNVILHVIWEGDTAAPDSPPVVRIQGLLDSALGELSLWQGSDAAGEIPDELRGKCCAPLRSLSQEELTDLLHQAAQARLESKAAQLGARARQAGWEQALWEGIFRALGYKHNVWPMQRLGELRPRWGDAAGDTLAIQARLFGLSGLLPADLPRTGGEADSYLRRVWDLWWRERDEFSDCILPRAAWRLHGSRPANHPQRRLALAAQWCVKSDLPKRLDLWCARQPENAGAKLLEALQVEPDDFWAWHWTFRSPRLKAAQPLLGPARATDLAVNVVLPWLWARASKGKNPALQRSILERYFAWPAAEDNSVLRLARQRLLGGIASGRLRGAADQQGLIQMVRDFCDHSNSICEACKLPEMVKDYCGL